jgi:LPS export ABC transporter protein LptC
MVACSSKKKPDKIAAFKDRSAMTQVHETEITTVISDSGVTRYRISSPRMDVYDQAAKPYWNFPKGIHFEKFDENLKVVADIHSKYARFNVNEKVWELKGKVKAMNIMGELFETEQLFWNQREKRIYSDTLIKITQLTRIINGIGFESNETMTKYNIRKAYGPIVYNENAAAIPTPNAKQAQTVPAPTRTPVSGIAPVRTPIPPVRTLSPIMTKPNKVSYPGLIAP